MFKKVLLVALALGLLQGAYRASAMANKKCTGWACEYVSCRPGYAVYIPEKNAYLPCQDFDRYVDGDESVLIRSTK